MSDKRKINIPFYPYLLLIFAITAVVVAGVYYINFPSQMTIVYGILGTALFLAVLAFACRPQLIKELFVNKKTLLWVNDIVLILIVISIGVLLSHIAFRRNFRYDFTRNKIFSLSELTMKTIRELDKEVKISAFFPQGSNEEGVMLDLFKEYQRHSDKLSWVMIDPMRDPVTSQKMNINIMGTVVVECGTNRQDVLPEDLFFVPQTQLNINETPKFTGEQAITSAIANVLSNEKKTVCVITGHDEASVSGNKPRDIMALKMLLNGENIEVIETSLLTEQIASNASIIVIAGPKQDYADVELDKLRDFANVKKGHFLIALDPSKNLPKLYDFLFKEYGVSVNYDIVVDPRGISQNYWTVCPELIQHEITKPIIEKKMIGLMFHCCSLTRDTRAELDHKVLMKTIPQSWAKRDVDNLDGVQFDKGIDAQGPLELAVIAQKSDVASGSKAVIIGDADIVGNTYIAVGANRDIIINTINWLFGNNKMISIRPRTLEIPRINFNQNDATKIFTLCVFGAPCLVVLIGLIVYFYRRRVR